MRRVLICSLAVVALAACGGGSKASSPTTATIPSGKVACSTMFAEGRPTDEVIADYNKAPCVEADGSTFVSAVASRDCSSGGELEYLDLGWGAEGGTWHAFPKGAPKTPPQSALDACNP